MLQTVLDHLDKIVRPAIRDYVAAEEALDAAHASKDQTAIAAARDNVMRLARTAAIETHHKTSSFPICARSTPGSRTSGTQPGQFAFLRAGRLPSPTPIC
jgi:hypothetical protein